MSTAKVYSGPLMMNNRSITMAMSTILSKENNISSPITVSEFINLLSFLETSVMSKKIFFDGTLPMSDQGKTLSIFDTLNSKTSTLGLKKALGISISPTKINKKEFPSLLTSSMNQSFDLIEHFKLSNENKTKSLDGNIEEFSRLFETYVPEKSRVSEANKLIEIISNNEKSFRGSKCAAAILISTKKNKNLYDIVFQHFKQTRNDAEKRLLIAALINRFRINYINAQAQKHNAAYLSSPNLESLRDQQILFFWKYLFKKMGKEQFLNRNTNLSDNLFDNSFTTFPIGLAILVNTRGTNPLNLLDTAAEYYDNNFSTTVSELSIKNNYVDLSQEKISYMEEKSFKIHYKDLRKKTYKPVSPGYKIGKKILPIMTKFTLGPVTDMVEELFTSDMITEFIGEEALSNMSEKFEHNIVDIFSSSNKHNKHNLYIDHYHRLNEFYSNSLDSLEDGLNLSNKVERLFGRKLIKG